MKIRQAVAACKEKEAAKEALQDAEREVRKQRAAEQATRERLHQKLAEQEARQKEKEQAAAKEIANRRWLEQATEWKAKEAAELKARKAAERAAAEETHCLAEQEVRGVTRREAAERRVKEMAERRAKEAEEQKLKVAAQRKTKEAVERKAKDVAEQQAKVKAISERKAKEAAQRKAKEIAKREAKEAAARMAKEQTDRKAKDSVAWEAAGKEEERLAQEAEELDFEEAEERAAAEEVAQEPARRESAKRNAEDLTKGARAITERPNALRRAEELARRDASKQEAIGMDTRQAHESKYAIAAQKGRRMALAEERLEDAQARAQKDIASERVQDRVEREVNETAEQRMPVSPPVGSHLPRAEPFQVQADWRAKIRCKYGERCKFDATHQCPNSHSVNPVVNSASVVSESISPQPAERQLPVESDVKLTETVTQHPHAEGDRGSKMRCKFGKNCKNLVKNTCVYRHTEAELAPASMGAGTSPTQSPHARPLQYPGISESVHQPGFTGFDTVMHKLDNQFPKFTDWQILSSKPSEPVNLNTSKPATRIFSQPADQPEPTQQENAAPGLLANLSPAVRLRISSAYIQTKDAAVLNLLAEGKHVPADGIAVDLGWVSAGYAPACLFCEFQKMKYSFRCRQGGAVACGRCKKRLGTVTPEDEAVLLGPE
ncbi:hypothetical protein PMIN06_004105 [Paraphaeosphaeria minitans]